jgi:hypothetical protein
MQNRRTMGSTWIVTPAGIFVVASLKVLVVMAVGVPTS